MQTELPKHRTGLWKWVAVWLLLLAGGAMVNVVVAWGCTLRVPMEPHGPNAYAMSTTGAETIVIDTREFSRRSVEPGFLRTYDLYTLEWRGRGSRLLRVSHWVGYNVMPENTGDYLIERESGWPLRSMFGQCRKVNNMYWAISVPPHWGRSYGWAVTAVPTPGVFLPLKPRWPAFIINTITYAAILWLIFFAWIAGRRKRRRRRGVCEECAYPIGVSPVCTECGAAIRKAQRTA